ncbi:MAG: hypothetical protein KDI79_19040 [Anaerolineae bacterium]|nr:hypothetical protein [Anaerolineae bacterium]
MKNQRLFISGIIGLMMVMVTACIQVSSPEASELGSDPAPVAESEGQSGSTDLAANPELMIVKRFEGVRENETATGSTFYAANPELLAAGRYTAPITVDEAVSDSAFWAANPELMIARRFAQTEIGTDSQFYANNPELMAARRFEVATEK